MSDIGSIKVKLQLDNQDFNQKVKRLPNEMSSVGDKLSGIFSRIGSTVAAAFSVAAITKFTKTMVQSAAKVQAANSQLEQTFGDMSDAATAAIKKVADESGIVETRLQGVGTSIFAFAKTTDMDSVTALNMMQEALQVTADSAAYYDRSLEDVSESLKSFLKGNYANDAALGLSCTETTRNTAANKLYGKSFRDLSEAQKQLTLLQMVKDANAASGALGQAARESDGLENVLGNLKEAWNQLLAAVGKPVLNGAVMVIKRVTEWLQRMTVYAKAAVSALSDLFGWETDNSAQAAQATSDAISNAVDNQEDLTQEVKNTNEEVKRGVASFDRLNIISESRSGSDDDSDNSDNNAVSSAVDNTITADFELDTSNVNTEIDKIKNKLAKIFEPLISAYKKYIKPVIDKVKDKIEDWKKKWNEWKDDLDLKPLEKSIENILSKIEPLVDVLLPIFEYIFENVLLPISKEFAEKILPTINNWIANIIGFITPIIKGIGDVLKPIWENILWPAFQKVSEWFEKIQQKVGPKLEILGQKLGQLFEKLEPIVDLLSRLLGPAISAIMDVIGGSVSDGLSNLMDMLGDIFDALGGLAEFLTGIFTGDMEKAGNGLKKFFMGLANTVVDIMNSVLITIYSTVALFANTIGGLIKGIGQSMGHNDWGWEISTELPSWLKIPHLDEKERQQSIQIINTKNKGTGAVAPSNPYFPHYATGAIVKAPTLAWVGDNSNASSGNPEVVAPLSDLNSMISTNTEYDTSLLASILDYLKRLYELFIVFRNNGGNSYQFIAQLNGETIFEEFVEQVRLYKIRHHGNLPW